MPGVQLNDESFVLVLPTTAPSIVHVTVAGASVLTWKFAVPSSRMKYWVLLPARN